MTDILAKTEKHVYESLYTHPKTGHRYGWNSHVKNILPTMEAFLEIQKKDTVLDWGCGKGWGMSFFNSHGIKSTGIDITRLGLLDDVLDLVEEKKVDFIECPVWDVPKYIEPHTWSLISGVLAQIPPERLDATMDNIRRLTIKGACIIQTLPADKMGAIRLPKMAGVEVYFSSWDKERWIEYLSEYFDVVLGDSVPGNGRLYFIWATTKGG